MLHQHRQIGACRAISGDQKVALADKVGHSLMTPGRKCVFSSDLIIFSEETKPTTRTTALYY